MKITRRQLRRLVTEALLLEQPLHHTSITADEAFDEEEEVDVFLDADREQEFYDYGWDVDEDEDDEVDPKWAAARDALHAKLGTQRHPPQSRLPVHEQLVENFSRFDWSELAGRTVSDMGLEVAEQIMNQHPNWSGLDEHPLERLVDEAIAGLRPGPIDDEWVDVIESAMAVLLDQAGR